MCFTVEASVSYRQFWKLFLKKCCQTFVRISSLWNWEHFIQWE